MWHDIIRIWATANETITDNAVIASNRDNIVEMNNIENQSTELVNIEKIPVTIELFPRCDDAIAFVESNVLPDDSSRNVPMFERLRRTFWIRAIRGERNNLFGITFERVRTNRRIWQLRPETIWSSPKNVAFVQRESSNSNDFSSNDKSITEHRIDDDTR